jgi:hypothetical protein
VSYEVLGAPVDGLGYSTEARMSLLLSVLPLAVMTP